MQYLNLIFENWSEIVMAAGTFASAVVAVLTVVNQLFPAVIPDGKLAKIEAVTSRFSLGTKKATITKKK